MASAPASPVSPTAPPALGGSGSGGARGGDRFNASGSARQAPLATSCASSGGPWAICVETTTKEMEKINLFEADAVTEIVPQPMQGSPPPLEESTSTEELRRNLSPFKIYKSPAWLTALYGISVISLTTVCLAATQLEEHRGALHPESTRCDEEAASACAELAQSIASEALALTLLVPRGAGQNVSSLPLLRPAGADRTDSLATAVQLQGVPDILPPGWLAFSLRNASAYADPAAHRALMEEVHTISLRLAVAAALRVARAGTSGGSASGDAHVYVAQLMSYMNLVHGSMSVGLAAYRSAADRAALHAKSDVSLSLLDALAEGHGGTGGAYRAGVALRGSLSDALGKPGTSGGEDPISRNATGVGAAGQRVLPSQVLGMVDGIAAKISGSRHRWYSEALRSQQKPVAKWVSCAAVAIACLLAATLPVYALLQMARRELCLRIDFLFVSDTSNVISKYCEMIEGWVHTEEGASKLASTAVPAVKEGYAAHSCSTATGAAAVSLVASLTEAVETNHLEKPQCLNQMELHLRKAVGLLRFLRPFVPVWIFASSAGDNGALSQSAGKINREDNAVRPSLTTANLCGEGAGDAERLSMSMSKSGKSIVSLFQQSNRSGNRSSARCSLSVSADAFRPTTCDTHVILSRSLYVERDANLVLVSLRGIYAFCETLSGGARSGSGDFAQAGAACPAPTEADAFVAQFLRLIYDIENMTFGAVFDVTPLYIVAKFATGGMACRFATEVVGGWEALTGVAAVEWCDLPCGPYKGEAGSPVTSPKAGFSPKTRAAQMISSIFSAGALTSPRAVRIQGVGEVEPSIHQSPYKSNKSYGHSKASVMMSACRSDVFAAAPRPVFPPSVSIVKAKVLTRGLLTTGMHTAHLFMGNAFKIGIKLERMNDMLGTTVLCDAGIHRALSASPISGQMKSVPAGVVRSGVSLQVACSIVPKASIPQDQEESADRNTMFNYIRGGDFESAHTSLVEYIKRHEQDEGLAASFVSGADEPPSVPRSKMTSHLLRELAWVRGLNAGGG